MKLFRLFCLVIFTAVGAAVWADEQPAVQGGLYDAIIREMQSNGIDEEWDLPAMKSWLGEHYDAATGLRVDELGELPSIAVDLLVEYAPENSKNIPIVVESLQLDKDLEQVKKAYDAIKRAADAASSTE